MRTRSNYPAAMGKQMATHSERGKRWAKGRRLHSGKGLYSGWEKRLDWVKQMEKAKRLGWGLEKATLKDLAMD